jgi:hypothetical protein
MSNFRKVERKNFNDRWEEIDFWELKKRDVFRLFEPTGEAVIGSKGESEFVAISNAYENDVGAWTVDIK